MNQELKKKFKIVEKEDDKMALNCPMGGYKNILRNAGTYDGGGDDTVPGDRSGGAAPALAYKGGGMAGAVDGTGDVPVEVPDQAGRGDYAVLNQAKYVGGGGAAHDQFPIAKGGGAVPIPVPLDRTDDAAKKVDDQGDVLVQIPVIEGGGTVTAPVDERGSVTQDVGDDYAVHVRVPVDEGSSSVQDAVAEVSDKTKDVEEEVAVHIQVPIDDGGAVQAPVDVEGDVTKVADSDGAVHDRVTVDEGGGAVQVQIGEGAIVAKYDEGGDETPVPIDKSGVMARYAHTLVCKANI